MIQNGEISAYLYEIVQYLGALFGALFVICIYGAYEINRRLQLIPKDTHPATRQLFNQLRFLLLFISLHFAGNAVQIVTGATVDILCLILAIVHLVSYIGIGITTMGIALSQVLTIGRVRDNRE